MIIYISSEYAKYLLLKIHILRPPIVLYKNKHTNVPIICDDI